MYGRQLAENKREIIGKINYYDERKAGPFYRIENPGSRLYETSSTYILETHIPEHEKNNVKVKVEKDRAIVSGTRSFNDKANEDGKKLETNTYQSFREQFDFEKPVANYGIIEERDGDSVTYTIPKLAYAKINKKA